MIKLNLLKISSLRSKKVERMRYLSQVVIFLSLGLFLIQVFYVSGRLLFLSNKKKGLVEGIRSMEEIVVEREDDLRDYVWVKTILVEMDKQRNAEYEYQKYLSEISSWLPSEASLVAVNFVEKDEIAFTVFTAGVDGYRSLAKSLDATGLVGTSSFKTLTQESVVRQLDGSYNVRIKTKLK